MAATPATAGELVVVTGMTGAGRSTAAKELEDVGFYVDEALASGGPVVELAVGTGRIAVPIARAGVDVIGVDSSPAMLAVARAAADSAGVSRLKRVTSPAERASFTSASRSRPSLSSSRVRPGSATSTRA